MTIELRIPEVGESIQEVQIGRWLKQAGDSVGADEGVVELETDKASMELPSPAAGVLSQIVKREGESVSVGDVIALIDEGSAKKSTAASSSKESKKQEPKENNAQAVEQPVSGQALAAGVVKKEATTARKESNAKENSAQQSTESTAPASRSPEKPPPADMARAVPATPSARRALREHGLTADEVQPAGDRLRASDVERHVLQQQKQPDGDGSASRGEPSADVKPAAEDSKESLADSDEQEKIVPMSLIRRRIAKRLVEAQQTAALLTTFNEIDMTAVIELREKYKPRFQEKYGIKLGFMSFFVKAVIDSLRQFPAINAEIREENKIAYRNYYHIGVAVGGGQGLVVPVLSHAERMSFAEIELAVADFAQRAAQKKLKPEELEGGTFTISNGGIYGSLLSTPIVNPPQSGVLGMHTIQDRPVAREKQVVIRPMMYVALTYDHRLVDGSEAVSFLKRIKDAIEDPARMLIEV